MCLCLHFCLSRTLGQHGGVHVYDPARHARWRFLQSGASPASGPLLIGSAGGWHHHSQLHPREHIKSLYFFKKHLIKTCHTGVSLVSWLLEFSLVFTARYEMLKSLETNTVKKHKKWLYGYSSQDRIPPTSVGFLLKQIKCTSFLFLNGVVALWCGNVM